ncbi:hypothetical protein [Cryptosporangium minutisporangium]|uniref:Uncharacterized protein n=1 Tax=Cryptosporangium minutisporangium TaxID=113569 RepID=A0ABP6SUX0_9ACTN
MTGTGESPGPLGPLRDDELDADLTPEQLAAEQAAAREALRRLHVPVDGVCDWCGQPFPCPDFSGGGR